MHFLTLIIRILISDITDKHVRLLIPSLEPLPYLQWPRIGRHLVGGQELNILFRDVAD